MKYHLTTAFLLAFIAMECVGIYWLLTGSLPHLLARVDPTVLVACAMGIGGGTVGLVYSMANKGPD